MAVETETDFLHVILLVLDKGYVFMAWNLVKHKDNFIF